NGRFLGWWRCVPDMDRPIRAGRGQAIAIRAEGHTLDAVVVPGQPDDFLAGHRVPDLDGVVTARRGQPPAVWRKGKAVHMIGVPAEMEACSARGSIPEDDRVVPASTCQ